MAIDVTVKMLTALAGAVAALALAGPADADPADPAPQPVVADSAAAPPADGVPHLASPDALPPGSTMDPTVMAGTESPRVSYLRDLWQAVQSREISGAQALVLGLSQRGMDTPNPVPATAAPNTPNTPVAPGDPAPPALPTP